MKLNVNIKLTRGMTAPEYASENAAAVDLRAALDENEVVTIAPGERAKIPTGVAISPERNDVVAILAGRSGHGLKNGVTLANSIGVIDSDYRGEICVGLFNTSKEPFTVCRGDRIAQMVITELPEVELTVTESLSDTNRGTGGFGSTGV